LRESAHFNGRIIGLGYDALDPGMYDKNLFDHSYLLPYPSTGKAALNDRINEIHKLEQLDTIIPCLDAEMLNFSDLEAAFKALGISMLIPTELQIKRRNKDRLADLCKALTIKTPESKNVTQAAFFYQCEKAGWHYPLVIKGVFYDATVVYTPLEAVAIFNRLAAEWGYPVLVQRFIKGDEINLTALGDGLGNMVGAVMMRKRAVTEKGKAWAGITVNDEKLRTMSAQLIAELQWRGPLEIEVMKGSADDYYLIEINPRFPAWIYLSHGADRNLPIALLQTLQEGQIPQLPPAKAGTLFIRHAQEIIVDLEQFAAITVSGAALGLAT
jgi:carbamoyl-phosphate synthase large subunit